MQGFAKRFVFSIVRKSHMTQKTMDVLLDVLGWSMSALLTGITPESSWEGRPLSSAPREYIASGYRGALIQVRGDWEFMSNTLELPHWNNNVNMCWQCRASNVEDGLLWQDFGKAAGWRSTKRSHSSFMAELRDAGIPKPRIFTAVIGLTLSCITVDVLHCVDLGVSAALVGNIFFSAYRRTCGAAAR